MDLLQVLGSSMIATGIAVGALAGRSTYSQAIDFVEDDLTDKLRRLRLRTDSLRKYLVSWTIVVSVTAAVLLVVAGSLIFAVTAAVLLVSLPWYVLRRLAETRRLLIEDQLADAMVSLSNAIKAGLSLAQALEILARQSPKPISQEFQQIVGEYQLGKDLEQCLKEAKTRLRSENFALFAAALEASRQSGGRLNETVERIATSVRELQRLERKVRSETAQARTSSVYMALAPLVILVMNYFIDPVHTRMLFTEIPGQMILCLAGILNLMAYFWARVILNPEI
ncbi:MAG: type II secretion system F family protein [Planctomycetota bacterium]|nr:type II secretion system F family protein [Planctomycetota bacterium]